MSLGVTQTATTVTGTRLPDSIDCSAASPGKTIPGLAGNGTITGTAFMDTIEGGSGNAEAPPPATGHVVARFPAMALHRPVTVQKVEFGLRTVRCWRPSSPVRARAWDWI